MLAMARLAPRVVRVETEIRRERISRAAAAQQTQSVQMRLGLLAAQAAPEPIHKQARTEMAIAAVALPPVHLATATIAEAAAPATEALVQAEQHMAQQVRALIPAAAAMALAAVVVKLEVSQVQVVEAPVGQVLQRAQVAQGKLSSRTLLGLRAL
jgi:hypothetical protein